MSLSPLINIKYLVRPGKLAYNGLIFSQKAANLAFVVVLLSIAGDIIKLVPSKTRVSDLFPARMHRAKVQSPPVILPIY